MEYNMKSYGMQELGVRNTRSPTPNHLILSPREQLKNPRKASLAARSSATGPITALKDNKKRNRIKIALELHHQLYTELERAAVTIQKHIKGYIARKLYKLYLIEKYEYDNFILKINKQIGEYWENDDHIRHMAAYRIQRYWKGFRKHPKRAFLINRLIKRILDKRDLDKIIVKRRNRLEFIAKLINIYEKSYAYWAWDRFREYRCDALTLESEIVSETNIEPPFTARIEVNYSAIEVTYPPIEEKNTFKPKLFILNEANFTKPTLSSKYRRENTPDSTILRVPKSKKCKKPKISKKNTSGIVKSREKSEKTIKSEEVTKIRINSEIKLEKSKKYENIKSKFMQIRLNKIVKSVSLSSQKKSYEDISELATNKDPILPTLGFKQALPELYTFIENYMPQNRKPEIIDNTSRAMLMPFTKKIGHQA